MCESVPSESTQIFNYNEDLWFSLTYSRSYSLYLRLKVWGCTRSFSTVWGFLRKPECAGMQAGLPWFLPLTLPLHPPPPPSPPFLWRFTLFRLLLASFTSMISFSSRHLSHCLCLKKTILFYFDILTLPKALLSNFPHSVSIPFPNYCLCSTWLHLNRLSV